MSASDKIMDEVRALVVLDITDESPGQLAALRHTIARTIGDLERARDAALDERNRLGVELAGARTRIADLEARAAAAAAEMTAWAERDALAARGGHPPGNVPLDDDLGPDPVRRLRRYAGQTMRTARSPNITAREAIAVGNWLAAMDSELAMWRKLQDPAILHVNLLRGLPAQLTREQARHLCADHGKLMEERDALQAQVDFLQADHAAQAAAERLRAELARYQPDGWRLGLPDGSHPPPAPLSDDGRTPAPPLVCVKLYRKDKT